MKLIRICIFLCTSLKESLERGKGRSLAQLNMFLRRCMRELTDMKVRAIRDKNRWADGVG